MTPTPLKKKFFDVHAHFMVPDALPPGSAEQNFSSSPIPKWSAQIALEFMDHAGIAVQMLSTIAPKDPALVRKANEFGASVVQNQPERFGLLASLPMEDTVAALAELDYVYDVLKADGVILLTNYEGKYLGDEQFSSIFAELNRRKATVFVHPTTPAGYECVACGRPGPLIEFPFDTCRTVTDMLYAGVLERFPSISFILSHAGGPLAALAQRIASIGTTYYVPHPPELTAERILAQLGTLYFDTAIAGTDASIAPVVALTSPDHIVFGTDFPPATVPVIQKNIEALNALKCLTPEEREAIGNNGRRLFKRFRGDGA